MGKTFWAASALTLLLVWAGEAAARPIYLYDDRRFVNAAGQNCDFDFSCDPSFDVTETPSAFGADFTSTDGDQVSSFAPFQILASGFASAYSDIGWFSSSSVFDIDFTVISLTQVDFFGSLSSRDEAFGTPSAGLRISLGETVLYELLVSPYGPQAEAVFDETLILTANVYTLEVWADGGGGGNGDSSYDFTLDTSVAQVPEPTTAASFALGLLGLGVARRAGRRRVD
jgi:hypothetical protein